MNYPILIKQFDQTDFDQTGAQVQISIPNMEIWQKKIEIFQT